LIRWRICNEEVYQAIERARTINRTADTPHMSYVLTNVILRIPIDGEIDADEVRFPTPWDQMNGESGVIFQNAATAVIAFPYLWDDRKTLGKEMSRCRQRAEAEAKRDPGTAVTATLPYRKLIIGRGRRVPENLVRVEFQRTGPKLKREVAYYDPRRISDSEAVISALVGALASFKGPEAKPAEPARSARIIEVEITDGLDVEGRVSVVSRISDPVAALGRLFRSEGPETPASARFICRGIVLAGVHETVSFGADAVANDNDDPPAGFGPQTIMPALLAAV
jgi:hypothetical protein